LTDRLEGNADERGSREYNLALGQNRAEAVKHALQLLGVPDSQVEVVSFGEEKPRSTCHEEKCWAENRRVDVSNKKPEGQ
jgi:peptidoglycan-associated lipoprotein